jgi:hypothetical protein
VIKKHYNVVVKFFHRIAAKLPDFPFVRFREIPTLFSEAGILSYNTAQSLESKILEKYKLVRSDVTMDLMMNRMIFIEILLVFIEESTML